jgi:hypothetical protein
MVMEHTSKQIGEGDCANRGGAVSGDFAAGRGVEPRWQITALCTAYSDWQIQSGLHYSSELRIGSEAACGDADTCAQAAAVFLVDYFAGHHGLV